MKRTPHWPLVARQDIKDAFVSAARADLDRPIDDIIEQVASDFCLHPETVLEAVFDH